jgi:hypothetical protein
MMRVLHEFERRYSCTGQNFYLTFGVLIFFAPDERVDPAREYRVSVLVNFVLP